MLLRLREPRALEVVADQVAHLHHCRELCTHKLLSSVKIHNTCSTNTECIGSTQLLLFLFLTRCTIVHLFELYEYNTYM